MFHSKCICNLIFFLCPEYCSLSRLVLLCMSGKVSYLILSLRRGKQTFNMSLVIRICYNVNRWKVASAILWWPCSWHPHPQRQIIELYAYVGLESSIISCVTVNRLLKLFHSSFHIFKNWYNSTSKGCCMWLHRLRFSLWITFKDTKSQFYYIVKFYVLYLKKGLQAEAFPDSPNLNTDH